MCSDRHQFDTNSLLQKAQSKRLNLENDSILSSHLIQLVTAHADAIGVPMEFILWPLLTTVASFIGTNGHIEINKEWVEPSIMWFVIAARKGEKKTAALRRIRKAVEEIENDLVREWKATSCSDKNGTPPQLIVDHFSFEELHSIMSKNNGQILGCFDEMSSFYGQLDLYKHSSTMDRKTLLTLNGGGAWTRNFKSYTGRIEKTAFNVTGFIQPAFVFDMLRNCNDADGLNDRQLIDFPPERELLLDELKVPMPANTPNIKDILLAVRQAHQNHRLYTLDAEAYEIFREAHDELVRKKLQSTDENVQGILSKSRGYVARLAMILHCLEVAIRCVTSESTQAPFDWTTEIGPTAVRAASTIVEHFNSQKLIALGIDGSQTVPMSNRIVRLLSMSSKNGDGILSLSDICQKHICEKVGTSYPISKATELVKKAADLGFGEVIDTETPNKRVVKRFRKRPLEELNDNCRKLLKTANVSDQKYTQAFSNAQSSSSTLDKNCTKEN